ncbi:MAG: NusG domain II-containing protein [Clostridia bacterium]|nr:NusG domain II-containing protein [Clostridia bacterium]
MISLRLRALGLMLIALLCALALAETTEAPEAPEATPKPAPGYVLVTLWDRSGWLALPEEGELSVPIEQTLPDGTEATNVVHLTPTGVHMEDSTCENHDCVGQGEVTLDNRKDRILGNMIICLPNQVVLELYTPEEILEMMEKQD